MVYKLNYKNRETAIRDLLAKGIYIEKTIEEEKHFVPGKDIDAVVDLQELITDTSGVNFDVLTNKEIDFGNNQIFPKTPMHEFL
jgi:hypothetical protein